MEVSFGPFHFSSDFECGNLAKVLPIECQNSRSGDVGLPFISTQSGRKSSRSSHNSSNLDTPVNYEFNLWTQPDCAGTEFENNNRTWFCFSIKGGEPGQRVCLSVMNLNRQYKLFSQGMQPVTQCTTGAMQHNHWERLKEKCSFKSEESSTVVSWIHIVPHEDRKTFYAFTYPYTYSDLQSSLMGLDREFLRDSSLYYHRELLVYSLDGMRLDLVTVSSQTGKSNDREDRLPGLFPDPATQRAHKFYDKKIVVISARVHPGETSSSFVLNGFLNFILSKDPRAVKLRDIFVFKFLPMLNPDGVMRGHYRTDQRGVNLNRVYINPLLQYHPTIFGARQIILYHHFGMQLPALLEAEEKCQLASTETKSSFSRPSLLDEDTCHSFGDAAGKTTDAMSASRLSYKLKPSLMEADEPSASGWDVSSNLSVDSSGHLGLGREMEFNDIHDDCSNFSCASEGETGVTSMFCSLSPLRDFKSVSSSLHFPRKDFAADHSSKDYSTLRQCTCANSTKERNFTFTSPSSCLKCNTRQRTPLPFDKKDLDPNVTKPAMTTDASESFSFGGKSVRECGSVFDASSSSQIRTEGVNKKVSSPVVKGASRSQLFVSSSESDAETVQQTDLRSNPKKIERNVFSLGSNRTVVGPSTTASKASNLFLYVDLHGHASKRGIFMYGNWFGDSVLMVENLLFPKLMSINCPNFDFTACNFSERNMYHKDKRGGMSKEGSGRVAVMQSTGLLRSYTLECNYNTGRTYNPVPPSPLSQRRPPPFSGIPPKYTPAVYEDCGRQLCVSLLDAIESNDWSRLPHSQYNSLSGVRTYLHSFLESSSLSPKTPSVTSSVAATQSHSKSTKVEDVSPRSRLDAGGSTIALEASRRLSVPKQTSPPGTHSLSPRRSRSRRTSWSLGVDAENQEPTSYLQSSSKARGRKSARSSGDGGAPSRTKPKAPRLKPPCPRTQKVARSLTYTEISDAGRFAASELCSASKHNLQSSVSLTPNLNVQLSISENIETTKQIKKMDGIKKQRRKGMNIGNKKLKMSPPGVAVDSEKATFYSLPNISSADHVKKSVCTDICSSNQGPLSPRSPLSSVCEPQASQSSQSGGGIINVLAIQPKSPSLVSSSSSKKTFHSPIKRPKHSLKSLSKSMDRLPPALSAAQGPPSPGGGGQRLKLLPKKVRKKSNSVRGVVGGLAPTGVVTTSASQPSTIDWIIAEPIQFTAQIEPKAKLKRRKKNQKS